MMGGMWGGMPSPYSHSTNGDGVCAYPSCMMPAHVLRATPDPTPPPEIDPVAVQSEVPEPGRPSWMEPLWLARHPFDDTGMQLHPAATGLSVHTHLIPEDKPHEFKQALARHIERWHRP